MKPMSIHMRGGTRTGMTLIEAVISSTLLAGIVVGAVVPFLGAIDVADVVNARVSAQTSAEQVGALIQTELRTVSLNGAGNPGNALVLQGQEEVRYTPLNSAVPLYDPADPNAVPFLAERRALRVEPDGTGDTNVGEAAAALNNGVDEDKDFVADDKQLSVYRLNGGTWEQVAVLARNLKSCSFGTTLDTTYADVGRLWVNVEVERVLLTTAKTAAEFDAFRTGAGPRVRHSSRFLINVVN